MPFLILKRPAFARLQGNHKILFNIYGLKYGKGLTCDRDGHDGRPHKLSRRLVDEFGVITFETSSISGMVRNHKLAKSISDAGWSQFIAFTQYKGVWYGAHIEKIDRFYASTKTCSDCGAKN